VKASRAPRDNNSQHGAADIACRDAGTEGTGQAKSDEDSNKVIGTRSAAGGSKMATSGSKAPAVNDSADAAAAWTG